MKRAKAVPLALLLLAASAWGIRAYQHSRFYVFTDDAALESQVVSVAARVAGQLWRVHVQEHQQVNRGQLLAELDPLDFRTRRDAARARVQQWQETVAQARAQVVWTERQTEALRREAAAHVQTAAARVEEARRGAQAARHRWAEQQTAVARSGLQVQVSQRNRLGARQQLGAAAAERGRAVADWRRAERLYATEAISRQQLEHARAEADSARELEGAARQRVEALRLQTQVESAARTGGQQEASGQEELAAQADQTVARLGSEWSEAVAQLEKAETGPTQVAVARRGLKISQAQLEGARQALALAERELSYTRLLAPWDGVVGRRPVEEGAYLQAGQPALQLVSSRVWVVANFKETQLARLRVGQTARVTLDARPDLALTGRVVSLQPGTGSRFSLLPPENASGNWVKIVQRLPVKLALESSPELPSGLAAGMSASVDVRVR